MSETLRRCPGIKLKGLPEHYTEVENFGSDKKNFDGLTTYCKACRAFEVDEALEEPQLIGDLMERCRMLTQREICRVEHNKISKDNPFKGSALKDLVDILCKMKAINIGTTNSEIKSMTIKQLETLEKRCKSEIMSRSKSKDNDSITQTPSNTVT